MILKMKLYHHRITFLFIPESIYVELEKYWILYDKNEGGGS